MRAKFLFFVVISFFLSSCLKKIEEVNHLNTNIFDKEYQGDSWFFIDDIYTYYNNFGQQFVRVEAVLPEQNMPELKPNLIFISCSVNDGTKVIFNAHLDSDGSYPFYYDLPPLAPGSEYCLEAGLYLEEEDTIINTFVSCTQL